ncbi:hypothetical protein MJO28_004053 [Puccinia striiformis f. sp. tritici]|uniref:Uncharacterized protein n=3 Tax=Puccinia striiformis TaxID=27350 RepID=A0A2S4WG88_9BASI|nr:hypothetical protein MJO28_004053 [Puccinia striiformis f. sp. tritici]POW11985.1 hypothetical protein PSTT_04785 [Puccinia striiformis]POW20773.1 hypothetical protein PSHT_03223 [Puccinia striiformis]
MQNSSNPLIPKSFPLENQSPSNHSSLPDAEYETDDPDGEYKIDENDGEYKTDDPDAEYETDDPDGEYKINENDPECLDLSNETCQLLSERARKTIKNTALHSKSFFPGCKPQLLTMTKNLKKQSFSIDSHTFSTSRDLIITNTGSGKKVLCLVSFHPSENRDSTYDQLAQLIEDSHLLASHCSNLKNKDKISDRMAGIGFRGGYEKGKTVPMQYTKRSILPSLSWIKASKKSSRITIGSSLIESAVFLLRLMKGTRRRLKILAYPAGPISSGKAAKTILNQSAQTYINRSTGTPTLPPSNTLGHGLRFPEYNCNIDFGSTPGIIEVLWKSNDIEHHTIGPPDKLKTTRSTTHHGCSFRISHQLVSRASSLSKLPHGKRNERVMYQNECSSKKSCKK